MITATTTYELISSLISGELSTEDANNAFYELVKIPISVESITDGVCALKDKMVPVSLSNDAIDTCGTGGSGLKTINTSTLTAFLVASAGGKVAKHGNNSASGNCGCFDLLEELGINTDITPDQEKLIFDETGLVFLYARAHHPTMKFVGRLRKEYGKKTIFNYLGPLSNPAGVKRQIVGVGNSKDAQLIAEVLKQTNAEHAFIATGEDGLDEVSVTSPTQILEIKNGEIIQKQFNPENFGIKLCSLIEIEGGSTKDNATNFMAIIKGEGSKSKKDLILVNAAYALLLTNLVGNIDEAFNLASDILKYGKVFDVFTRYKEISNSFVS